MGWAVYGKSCSVVPKAVNLAHYAAPEILSVFHLCFLWATLILRETPAKWGVRILSLGGLVLGWH